uniref:AT-rich interactive domain-containing protein 2 n=1 Tax=Fundulus heteroclitus TaxID=8078 RepID=A0A146SED2_FUNHE
MPEMTETKTPGRKSKKKKNKESHNAVERHRKEKINAGINRIGNLLPCSQALKQSKNMILDQAFRYITELKKQNDTLLLEGGDKAQAEEIVRLRRQLDDLRKESANYIELLKAYDINLFEDPTSHWKGKHRCAKVAKVTPTHQSPKTIVVHSNGNVIGPAGKQASPGKKPSEAVQPPPDARLQVNGPLLQVNPSCSAPALLPGSAAAPVQSASALRVLEQCVVETPAVAPSLPPSVSYITLQIPAATTSLLQQAPPDPPPPIIPVVATSVSQHPTESNAQSLSTRSTSTQTMTSASSSGSCPLVTQDTAIRTVSYSALPANQTILRAGAAGSTQTTWTTLQMAGNTVQPVCQSLSSPDVSSTAQAVQQVAVCPVGSRPSVNPVQIQLQPHVPVPRAPITTHIPAAALNRTQPVLNGQPQCAVLPQSAIVPQPAVMARPAVVSQPQPAVLQPASLVPHPPTALIPQPQQTLVPQHQAAVLPLLQTMQVLQVNPAAAASGVTAPQSTNNPSVVILQQASACPTQQVVREDISNPTPCQHIVIIQAPSQAAPAPQSSQLSIGPPSLTAVSTQMPTTTSSAAAPPLQSVGGKQLVHILPRPTQPEVTHPPQGGQDYSSSPVSTNPQTITVNGQVFALKPVKTSDKVGSHLGQSTLQLVQPTTTEEPTTNVALDSLEALSSLNQSISQGLPRSTQSGCQLPPTSSAGVIAPVCGAASALPAQQLPLPSGMAASASKPSGKKPHAVVNTKRAAAKRTKSAKKKEPKTAERVFPAKCTANAAAAAGGGGGGESQTVRDTASQVLPSSTTNHPTCTTTAEPRGAISGATSGQDTQQMAACSSSSSPVGFSPTPDRSAVCASQSDSAAPQAVSATAPKPPPSGSVFAAETKTTSVSGSSSVVTKPLVSEVKQVAVSATPVVTQSLLAASASKQSKSTVPSAAAADAREASPAVSSPCLPPACIQTTAPVSLNQNAGTAQPPVAQKSKLLDQPSSAEPESQPTASSSASAAHVLPSPTPAESAPDASVAVSSSAAEMKKRATTSRAPAQQTEVSVPQHSLCHPAEVKPTQTARADRDALEERPPTAVRKEGLVGATPSEAPLKKDFPLSQQVYTNLDDQAMEQNMTPTRQSDSPLTTGGAGGRGFSVASMLPQGHGIGASSGSFGSFAFTSEQAEMLALAMLEQDSPERRSGGCSGDTAASAAWDPPKTPPVSAGRDRASAGQQGKTNKAAEQGAAKHGDASVGGPSRHPQNVAYSKPQPLPPGQSQSSTQGGTAASLSVNNLIRPSSGHQPYPSSPSLTAQQGSAPSPAAAASAHMSQPSNNAISPCSGAAQAVEYGALKNASIRGPPGNVVGERHVKIVSKRQAQEEVMLNAGKRPKPCPAPANAVGHMDVKAPDHGQIMVGQLPATSSAVMTRINSDSGGPLFSANSFMSSAGRPTDAHCPAQGPPEQNQAGGLHLPQGHPQHSVSQAGQHLGGNIYMKQQQQEQQRHHLYHLQHHLTQSDPTQRHSLHQRALQEQQQQHVQKKRGIVRGNQTGSPAGLQQKQHHLEKTGIHQHQHQQQQQQSQHQHQQSQQHQQPTQHQASHPQQQQQQQQGHQQPPQAQHQQQLQQQQQQQQNSHPRHAQHLQQQIQQQPQHFRHQEKTCEAQSLGSRNHHNTHLAQQDHLKQSGQDHNAMQRMMSSRSLEQQLISPSTNTVSRSSELACAPSRQERHRVSNYSAEALIGKSSTSGEHQQRMALHLQPGRGATQEQPDLRSYLDTSRGKAGIAHNPQNRHSSDHSTPGDQRISECQTYKAMGGGGGTHQLGGFETQVSRGSDMAPKAVPPSQRGPQGQQQGGFRMSVGPPADVRNRGSYSGPHSGPQGVQVGPPLPQGQEGCHQGFMHSLLSPHLPEQTNHQRGVQCCPPVSMEYSCVPGSSSGDVQAKASSPSVPQSQKAPAMRLAEGNKGHISQVSSNMHPGPGVRAGLPHPPTPHSSSEPGRSSAISRPPPAVSQHSRHIPRDAHLAKLRPSDRPRPGALRPTNPFEPEGHLPLPSGGGVLLGRPQSGGENRRSAIVRFMADSAQVPSDNNLVADQHLAQNFGFPFISEGGMNPPPPINANSTFIPPVSQPSTSRTPSLLPVEPQNTLPSFYPSYSPAAHPSLPSDVTLQYFPNQMFTSPSADKASAPPLNNRFGSILSPPRPVGFGQPSFPLLPDMPPMPSSGITPHISNFSLTSLFPEIASGMPTDGTAMPMSPLLSLANTSSADSGKQPNRPAHNISHILGHDGSSAV